MNYRKLPFDDLQSADNWLTEALLNRQAVSADRLLETTRLTDLIYTGCSFEDVYYGTHRADQPVNAESLAADIFAGLFSPVLRRKDTDNVNLRERLFNKPVLDRLLSDDRFDRMKGMCENKELPSYAAAASFAHSLNSALVNKPYQPKVYYLQIIKPEKGNGGEQHGNDYHCGGSAVGYGFTHSAILSAQRPLRREIPREAQYTGRTKMRE